MNPSLKLVSSKPYPPERLLELAREVVKTEINGLAALQQSLDQNFADAIALLYSIKGKVILTGMGKSGHVARKIASTLASTGTPSQFVHPAEASHGDLGMIAEQDAVIALSYSGEAPELSDIMAYCKRFSIPLIGITGKNKSTLAQLADICLTLPDAPEACPMGLAPTTSTAMALALGDAIALTLLQQKGFSKEQFRDLHPGGKLGQKLLRVEQLMHGGAEIPAAKPDDLMKEVLIEMTAKRFGCVAITDAQSHLLGTITDGDLRRHMAADFLGRKAEQVMTKNPLTVATQSLAAEALGIMNQKSVTCLFVVDDGILKGVLHIHDCLRAGVA